MAIKKSELYSSLWKSCDELRGGMDASQYKDYVLVLLFVKYVSDKARSQKNYLLEVPKGGGFADMVALKGDKETGDKMNKIVARLADKNELKGVIDVADWNDADKLGKGKDMVDRLSNLVGIFDNPALDFRGNRAEGDDLLGDAYEYLMRHFATDSGKSKGQFYTPAEVSRIMAKVIGAGSAKSAGQSIHDPTCGSGSLLLKAHDEAKGASGLDLALYGQEMDNATRALARMNMILHDCPTAEIWQDNTLSSPHFKDAKTGALKTFDFVVANPPFSTKAWTNGFDPGNDLYGRFAFGVPPQKNGDYAFLLHILASLKSTGKGAVILPHGVLFRGGAEATIRREIVKRGLIKGIIGLPANLFFGTGIPACILVVDKEGAAARKGIFMIDAARGFIKDGNKNRLRAQDIHRIVDAFTRQMEIPRFSRMVPLAEIADAKNDFNLNLPRYIDSSEPEDIQDIDGHLRGGIPDRDIDALARYWQVFPGVRTALFQEADWPGYVQLRVAATEIKASIFGHAEFTAWSTQVKELFRKWREANAPRLRGIAKGDKPKELIDILAEDLLATFQKAKLLDAYDIYQHLMDYWAQTMQDDVYLLVSDGWRDAAKPRLIVDGKDKQAKDRPDFTIGKQRFKAELIPATLLIARYFARDQAGIVKLESEAAAIAQALEELTEEHGGEEGLLAEAKNDKDKLTKASVAARLKNVKDDSDAADECKVLGEYLALIEKEATINAKAKAAQEELTAKVAAKYGRMDEGEIKMQVVDDKWLAAIEAAVHDELDRVSQTLTGRVQELAERYATPLPKLAAEVATLAGRVDKHLRKMGAIWNLKSGFKQSVVGPIPLNWEVAPLGESLVGRPRYGINAAAVPFSERLPTYIRITDISSEGQFAPTELVSVDAPGADNYFLDEGDIVFARTGASVGKSYRYRREDGRLVFAGFLIRVRTNPDRLLSSYLASYVATGPYWSWVRLMSMRSGQPGINGNEYSQLPVPHPPVLEQRCIADVLADVDALLGALDRLIAKKRDLKQAAMQQLLTGQTRLPGFSGTWATKPIGEMGEVLAGKALYANGPGRQRPYLRTTNVLDGRIDPEDVLAMPFTDPEFERYRLKSGDVLLNEGQSLELVGRCCMYRDEIGKPCAIQNQLVRFRARQNVSPEFAEHLFRHCQLTGVFARIATQTTSVAHLGVVRFSRLQLLWPCDHAEQTAIATVLSDMDAEIAALEGRRDKTRLLKQGMMQEFLTGRTRLV